MTPLDRWIDRWLLGHTPPTVPPVSPWLIDHGLRGEVVRREQLLVWAFGLVAVLHLAGVLTALWRHDGSQAFDSLVHASAFGLLTGYAYDRAVTP